MKRAALLLATLALVAAASTGAGAQQQTFWTAHAGATGRPTPSAQPISPYIYYNACAQGAKRTAKSGNAKRTGGSPGVKGMQCGGRRPSPHPSRRPREALKKSLYRSQGAFSGANRGASEGA
ncbi:MAG TPA: hypothetical protein VMF11_16355 [Candidatus Baltobacteraceae bacterium]|nr:hypothetical protein [Candidatus Baltobacteraceae bacterium]